MCKVMTYIFKVIVFTTYTDTLLTISNPPVAGQVRALGDSA